LVELVQIRTANGLATFWISEPPILEFMKIASSIESDRVLQTMPTRLSAFDDPLSLPFHARRSLYLADRDDPMIG